MGPLLVGRYRILTVSIEAPMAVIPYFLFPCIFTRLSERMQDLERL